MIRPILLLLVLLFPETGFSETIRVLLREAPRPFQITSNKPFFAQTVLGELAASAAYNRAEVSLMKGIAINQTDTGEKTVVFTPQRGGKLSIDGLAYPGDIGVTAKNGLLIVVNETDIEEYLRGVVSAEMPHQWPMEALKTQAIISRTYALYQKRKSKNADYDIVATVLGQVYKGASAYHPRTDAAIADTDGIIVTHEGAVAQTFFHSTSAGPTEDAQEQWGIDLPYLKGVSCPLDQDSPYYMWEREIPLSDLEKGLAKLGVRMTSTLTPLAYSKAGRVLTVRVLHEGGETVFKAEELRRLLGYRVLPSTHFKIDSFGKTLKFSGMGWGHGIGLCQWGAKVMAERGLHFDEILLYYYPGVELESR